MTEILVNSEIAPLEAVIVHRPGLEVELMSPQAAHQALFDDIIYLAAARREHDQLTAALSQFATVYELCDLLRDILALPEPREEIVRGLCELYQCSELAEELLRLPDGELAHQLLVGTPARLHSLTTFLADTPYALPPLYNLYFTRDIAICINDHVVISAMRDRMRQGEALLTHALFRYHPELRYAGIYFDGTLPHPPEVTMEGGDILVLREDLLLIGLSERTSSAGIDQLVQRFAEVGTIRNIIVHKIPRERPFIHFDMVFTLLDHDLCAIHEPVIHGQQSSLPILIELRGRKPPHITRHDDLLALLASLGMPLTPVLTGGSLPLQQAREQWQKGTNFFALAPGKIIGYTRNEQTYRELESFGFRIVAGADVLAGRVDLTEPGRIAVAMDGAELSRGGGGCRCMTLPVRRQPL